MRIAYIVHYQGPGFTRERPCLHNRSLGNRVKVELIASALKACSHDVEVLSQGEVDRNEFKYYPFYRETEPFHPEIPVLYASALPIRFVTGIWSANRTLSLLKARNRIAPFDLVIVHTLKTAQIACANYARRHLKVPVVLEYEDDTFSDVLGRVPQGFRAKYHHARYRKVLSEISGCLGVSPYLLSQLPAQVPKMLLRGVVNPFIAEPESQNPATRKDRAVFSGTHEGAQGLDQMIEAWKKLNPAGWELHIAGEGPITGRLKEAAAGMKSIVFHGFLNKEANARLICSAKIGMNPQDPTLTPGTSFAFKIIEYLAGGLHVITTPRGNLEPQLEKCVTYIQENSPDTIAAALAATIKEKRYEVSAREATLQIYGFKAVAERLNEMLGQVVARNSAATGADRFTQTAISPSAFAR